LEDVYTNTVDLEFKLRAHTSPAWSAFHPSLTGAFHTFTAGGRWPGGGERVTLAAWAGGHDTSTTSTGSLYYHIPEGNNAMRIQHLRWCWLT